MKDVRVTLGQCVSPRCPQSVCGTEKSRHPSHTRFFDEEPARHISNKMFRRLARFRKKSTRPSSFHVVAVGDVHENDMGIEFPELPRYRFLVPLRRFLPEASRLTRKILSKHAVYVAPHELIYFHSATLMDRLFLGKERGDDRVALGALLERGLAALIRGEFEERAPEEILAAHVVALRCGLPAQHELISRIARAQAEQSLDGRFFDV